MKRTASVVTGLICVSGAWGGAHGQLGISRSDQKVLVLWPLPASNIRNNPADSTLAVAIGDQLREKLDVKERFKMRVPSRAAICEVLTSSGFRCPEMLDGENADRLASAMTVDAYVIGVLTRNSKPTLHIRLVDLKRTGLSGWITIVGDTSWKADQFGSVAVDSIDNSLRGSEAAHDCYDKLDHNDVKGAREKVNDAFKLYPNHPGAALCLARYFDATKAPVDSIIFALEKATRGDSMNPKPWDRLANSYMEKNNQAKAVEARDHQLIANPRNVQLRKSVAAGWIELKQYQKGVDIIDVGLADNPLDVDLLNMKQRACLEAQMWKCALSALSAFYDADSTLKKDSVFYAKTFGAAQSLNDTAAMLKWSALAVKFIPNSLTMWRARAAALNAAGRKDSAVVAYQHVLQFDSTDVNVTLTVVRSWVESFNPDTLTPLDTARLGQIDRYLTRSSKQTQDSTLRETIGTLYVLPGIKVAATRKNSDVWVPWLEKALTYPQTSRRIVQQASLYLGFNYYSQGATVDPQIAAIGHPAGPPRAMTPAENAKACGLLAQEKDAIGKAKQYLTVAQGLGVAAVNQVLGQVGNFETTRIPTYKKFFKCTN